jgi:ribose 5-phosphate isomerase RpiB
MRIAVVSEVSAVAQNIAVVSVLESRGHEIVNAGMKSSQDKPELTYIHTGLLAALLLNTDRADLVVGGCGTGQGFMTSVMQYPNVICGLIANALDAWLFAQINGGNCISLPLLYGYGWAGDVNLRFVFDALFNVKFGKGYPPHRQESQQLSRRNLARISMLTHKPFAQIIESLDDEIIRPVLSFPGVVELLAPNTLEDMALRDAIARRMQ